MSTEAIHDTEAAEPCDCLNKAARAHQDTQHIRLDKATGRRAGRCRPVTQVTQDGTEILPGGGVLDSRCRDLINAAAGWHLNTCSRPRNTEEN